MSEPLAWHTENRKVKDLCPYENNPRILTEKQAQDLRASLEKFNLVEIPAINTNNMLVAGHQRIKIMMMLGRGEEEIDVRVPNRPLTDEEFREYLIRSNKNTGEWDFEMLANEWDAEAPLAFGFTPKELGGFEPSVDESTAEDSVAVKSNEEGNAFVVNVKGPPETVEMIVKFCRAAKIEVLTITRNGEPFIVDV
jgi:ParB-like chromosome segregation protein Spo0J